MIRLVMSWWISLEVSGLPRQGSRLCTKGDGIDVPGTVSSG